MDREADVEIPCIVEITRNFCKIKYDDESRTVYVWEGSNKGADHYVLKANKKGCEATLHRIQDSVYLEGFWKELGCHGMWRVRLKEKP
jgi:hypothetical protein